MSDILCNVKAKFNQRQMRDKTSAWNKFDEFVSRFPIASPSWTIYKVRFPIHAFPVAKEHYVLEMTSLFDSLPHIQAA